MKDSVLMKHSSHNNILIIGHYGVPNWGDEAILAGLLKRIDQKKWKVTVMSHQPAFTRSHHKVSSAPHLHSGVCSKIWRAYTGDSKKAYRALEKANYVIFGGGGLFQEQPKKALKIWNSYLTKCIREDKKILLAGNSLGPFVSEHAKKRTQKLFAHVSFFSLRDEASYKILKKMGVSEQRINLSTDFSFLLPEKKKPYVQKKGIFFILRKEDFAPRELAEIRKFARYLQKNGEQVSLLPLQTEQTKDAFLAEEWGIPLLTAKDLDEVRKSITSAKFVVTNRLHGAILSMLSATPFLAFASRPKISDFLQSANLSDCLFHNKITDTNLRKKYRSLKKKTASVRNKIEKSVDGEKGKCKLLLPNFF